MPAGFTVTKFAENLNKPRMLATGAGGTVYATDRDKGTATMLRDTNNDGKANQQRVVTIKEKIYGIDLHNGKVMQKGWNYRNDGGFIDNATELPTSPPS